MEILLVEHEDELRTTLKNSLIDLGHTVTTAMDGFEAMLYVRRYYDLMLIDYDTPYISGSEISSCVRRFEKRDNLIVALTKTALKEHDINFDYTLKKPIRFNNIKRLIQLRKKLYDENERSRKFAWDNAAMVTLSNRTR